MLITVLLSMLLCFGAVTYDEFATNPYPDISVQAQTIYTDTEFVKSKFPKLSDVEQVNYRYIHLGTGGVGLQPKRFDGLIRVSDEYASELRQRYVWEDFGWKKDTDLDIGSLPDYIAQEDPAFLYSSDFDDYIATESFGGYFFLDKEKSVLYFFGGY